MGKFGGKLYDELYLRILNAVDRITCHWHKETVYSMKEFDLDGFNQSQ